MTKPAIDYTAVLSKREIEIAEAVFDGKPSKTIAFELGLSIKTVEVHRRNIYAKLGCNLGYGAIVSLVKLLYWSKTGTPPPACAKVSA